MKSKTCDERLTNHFDYCKMIDCKFYDPELFKQGKCKFFDIGIQHCHEKRMNDKLREYEDAEEQGLLIRLPCKVGDDVWTIMCGMTGKHPALFRQEFTLSMFSHFGTAVFLTKEEAEAALERMG